MPLLFIAHPLHTGMYAGFQQLYTAILFDNESDIDKFVQGEVVSQPDGLQVYTIC